MILQSLLKISLLDLALETFFDKVQTNMVKPPLPSELIGIADIERKIEILRYIHGDQSWGQIVSLLHFHYGKGSERVSIEDSQEAEAESLPW